MTGIRNPTNDWKSFSKYKNPYDTKISRSRAIYRFLQILLFSHYLHIVYIGILICISTLRNNVRNKDNKKL